jgi:hypothetical protein
MTGRGKHRRRWLRWPFRQRSAYEQHLDQLEAEIRSRPWPTAAEIWDPHEASTLTALPCFRPEPGTLPALPAELPLSPEHQLQVLVFEIKLDVARIRQIRIELAALSRTLLAAAA